jgi:hypothetical protein
MFFDAFGGGGSGKRKACTTTARNFAGGKLLIEMRRWSQCVPNGE